ncbi:MAG: RNA polymerase sigma factor [Bacteroidales bacterium]|jgi:RNA polymerase sigma-70 factor (ECF subfamily)|nr:RNA polymerase sigma factor [Bacteroidales bacterium]
MKYTSDEDCIERILKGDSRAFSWLIEHHKNMVFTIVFRIVEQREEAEEVAQDVFIKIFQTIDTFKGSSKFSTWLYRIAYNMAISHIRKSKPDFVPLHDNVNESSDEIIDSQNTMEPTFDRQRQEALSEALTLLKQEEILLINMHYSQQMSVEQISEITDLSQSNVKVKLFRARKKLSELINEIIERKQ